MRLLLLPLLLALLAPEVKLAQSGDRVGSFRSVVCYSNGADTGTGRGTYQCVELIKRYVKHSGYNLPSLNGAASNLFPMVERGEIYFLEAYPNKSDIPPISGDILCFEGGGYGHLAIVTNSSYTTLDIIEQNWYRNTAFVRLSTETRNPGGYIINPRGKSARYKIQGWCRLIKKPITRPNDGTNTTIFVLDRTNRTSSGPHKDRVMYDFLMKLRQNYRPNDRIGIVVDRGDSSVLLPVTTVQNARKMLPSLMPQLYRVNRKGDTILAVAHALWLLRGEPPGRGYIKYLTGKPDPEFMIEHNKLEWVFLDTEIHRLGYYAQGGNSPPTDW